MIIQLIDNILMIYISFGDLFFSLWSTGLNNETLATLASFIPQCMNLR